MQSEHINELASALAKAQGEFSTVPKGSVNPFFKSKYADLADVIKSAGPVLASHGLAVSQFISEDDTLTTYLIHESGQFIAHRANLHLVKDDPQSAGSATTYARRYGYMSCLGLVADEDDDGNRASRPEPTSRPQRAAQAVKANGVESGRPRQPTLQSEQASGDVYTHGAGNKDFDIILEAAVLDSSNDFIQSLATRIRTKGHLTDPQLESGVPSAHKIVHGDKPREYAPESERFA